MPGARLLPPASNMSVQAGRADHDGTTRRGLHLMAQRFGAGDLRLEAGHGAAGRRFQHDGAVGQLRALQGSCLQRACARPGEIFEIAGAAGKASPTGFKDIAGRPVMAAAHFGLPAAWAE